VIAVVTGAQGIGRSVSEALAADGSDLALLDLRDSDITGQVPMTRFAAPDDVAPPVDGGWTAGASWTSRRLSKRPG
jgi:hypothetical protein